MIYTNLQNQAKELGVYDLTILQTLEKGINSQNTRMIYLVLRLLYQHYGERLDRLVSIQFQLLLLVSFIKCNIAQIKLNQLEKF